MAAEPKGALQLINFQKANQASGRRKIARQTVARWLYGYEHGEALWRPDFLPTDNEASLEVSFRDLIELRCLSKPFALRRLSLQTIRECFGRAVGRGQRRAPVFHPPLPDRR